MIGKGGKLYPIYFWLIMKTALTRRGAHGMIISSHQGGARRKGNTMTATTAMIAAELDTTPRELRKFLRSIDAGVGKGSRYALPSTKRDIAKLRKGFDAWSAAQDAKRAAKDAAPKAETPKVIEVEVDQDDEVTDLEGPTDADLDDIDAEV